MGNIFYLVMAIAIGVGVSLQPPINAVMSRSLGSPLLAATISILISLVCVVLLWLSLGKGAGDFSQVKTLPWWIIVGGMVGVGFVAGGVIVAPVLGIALFIVCVIAGQLLGSSVIDQIGAFGLPAKPINTMKLIGLALVLAGVALVQNSNT